MNFGDAVRRLGIPAADVASVFGVQPQSLRQMALAPGKTSARRPPDGWQHILAQLARERAHDLEQLAETLEPGTVEPVEPEVVQSPAFPYNIGTAT